jgi:hypothetical protein
LVEFDVAGVGDNGELTFTEEQLCQIQNIDETELALNTSKMHAGNRLGWGLQAGPWQNLYLPAREYLAVTLQASVCHCTSSYQQAQLPRRGRRSGMSF